MVPIIFFSCSVWGVYLWYDKYNSFNRYQDFKKYEAEDGRCLYDFINEFYFIENEYHSYIFNVWLKWAS